MIKSFLRYITKKIGYHSSNESNMRIIGKKIEFLYHIQTKKKFNIDNPRSFTEKIQSYKLLLKDQGYEKYTDKISVREWIKNVLGEEYLIPLYGTWQSPEEINYDQLPQSFVLKTNHGAGMNLVIKDKRNTDTKMISSVMNKWLQRNYCFENGFEYQYKKIQPRVYAEKLLSDSSNQLREYKFLCFSGVPKYCMVDFDRFNDHKRNIYDLDWNLQDWNIGNYQNASNIPPPSNFNRMIEISKLLSKPFSHVRVDLYDVDGKVYFSELTFTTGSGYSFPKPESANKALGDLWDLNYNSPKAQS